MPPPQFIFDIISCAILLHSHVSLIVHEIIDVGKQVLCEIFHFHVDMIWAAMK